MADTWRRGRGGLAVLMLLAAWIPAGAHPTGVPSGLAFTPRVVVQGDAGTSQVTVIVALKAPSPTFFVCELRSSDPRAVRFSPLIFSKGQVQAKGMSVVLWSGVAKDEEVKVTAFSVDNPDVEITSKLMLQPKPESE